MPKIVATREQWIKLGYQLFSEAGITGVNVEVMSRKLKCNRSSFYWHFKTKNEFIHHLIEFWKNLYTDQVLTEVNELKKPKEKLSKLIEIVLQQNSNPDFIFYLKKYGQKNNEINTIVQEIDKRRISFGRNILLELGYSKEEAKIKSLLVYKYLIGHHEMIKYKRRPKNYPNDAKKEIKYFLDL